MRGERREFPSEWSVSGSPLSAISHSSSAIFVMGQALKGGLPRLQVGPVEVPELAARDELAEGGGCGDAPEGEQTKDQGVVVVAELGAHGVGAELANPPADVDGAGVHAVGHAVGRVAADDDDALLHHEPGARADAPR